MDIEINTISNKNAKNIIFILFSLAIVLLVIQFAVPEKTKQSISNQVFSNNEESTQDAVVEEFSGTVVMVDSDLSFIKVIREDEASYSFGFTDSTPVTANGVKATTKDLKSFSYVNVKAYKLPEGERYDYKAVSIDMTERPALNEDQAILQDMVNR